MVLFNVYFNSEYLNDKSKFRGASRRSTESLKDYTFNLLMHVWCKIYVRYNFFLFNTQNVFSIFKNVSEFHSNSEYFKETLNGIVFYLLMYFNCYIKYLLLLIFNVVKLRYYFDLSYFLWRDSRDLGLKKVVEHCILFRK